MQLARERWLSAHGSDQGPSASPAGHATGSLTGVVRGPGGLAVAGARVTATGRSGTVLAKSRASGRYLLPRLPAGHYTVRIANCAGASAPWSAFLWPQVPAGVVVAAGQVHALPAVTAVSENSDAAAVARSSAAEQAGTGAISGRVTGHGRPLKGICAAAERVGGGQGFGAVTVA
jgi:Carboxypeptidase regulatory-like domain